MKKYYLGFCLFLIQTALWAGNDLTISGGQSAGLAKNSVTIVDPFAVFSNPASMSDLSNIAAGVYVENRFLVEDLNLAGAAFALPTNSGTFGLGVQYFGFSDYNEKMASLAYGRRIGENFSIGAQFDYFSLSMGEYGNKSAITFGLGMVYQPTDDFKIGAHIYNPLRISLTDDKEDNLATVVKLGFEYEIVPKVRLLAEAEKNIIHPAIIKVAVEYQLIDALYLRGGVSTDPALAHFGIGVNMNKLKIDLAGSYHNVLGYTPQISISFFELTGKRKDESTIIQ